MYWFYIALWPTVYLLYSNIYDFQNKSIIFNLISSFHSLGCFYLSLITYHEPNEYNYQRLALFSASYFIWDSFKLILKNIDLPFLYHHIFSIHVLEHIFLLDVNNFFYIKLIILGELSNFPNYLVYHLLKTKGKDDSKTKYWRHIQVIWFLFFRIIVFSFILIKLHKILDDKLIIFNLYAMYILGIIWGFKQFKGLYQDYYQKIKDN